MGKKKKQQLINNQKDDRANGDYHKSSLIDLDEKRKELRLTRKSQEQAEQELANANKSYEDLEREQAELNSMYEQAKRNVEYDNKDLHDSLMNKRYVKIMNGLIRTLRHLFSGIVYLGLFAVIATYMTTITMSISSSLISSMGMMSDDLVLIASTSFTTAILVGILMKSNLYGWLYGVFTKLLKDFVPKDARKKNFK